MKMTTLETYRLRLRPFTLEDIEDYYEHIHSNAEVMRFLPGGAPRPKETTPQTLQYFIDHWAQHNFGMWALEDRKDRSFIGHVGLNRIPEVGDVEIAYALGKAYWGKGLATEAAAAVLSYGLDVAGLNVLYALAFPENAASQRVMVKLGMRYEGIVDRYYKSSMACYYITAEEPEE
jgi:ribosomal-protein-alanine N-acetyltransferase